MILLLRFVTYSSSENDLHTYNFFRIADILTSGNQNDTTKKGGDCSMKIIFELTIDPMTFVVMWTFLKTGSLPIDKKKS